MIRHGFRPLVAGALLLLAASCAAPPTPAADPDLVAGLSAADDRGGLDLLRRQEERITRQPFVGGNRVELLEDGPATYAAMTGAILGARRRIDMESYQFDTDEAARFARLLLDRRAAGVEVNLIYDAWGSADAPAALFDALRRGGVRVLEFNPLPLSARVGIALNRRDHRKLLVVDGALAITGGVNVTNVYENRPGAATDDPQRMAWRDTDLRVAGPVVAQFQRLFERSWAAQHGPPLLPAPPTPAEPLGTALVQAVDGDPAGERPLIYRTLLAAVGLARRSVHLTTGFFVPTPELEAALVQAARRGVDVQLMLPAHSDSAAALAAGRAHYAALLAAGVRIHERQGRVLHAKTAVIDGAWSAIGSSNLDWRSVVHNQEIDAIVLDEALGRQMEAMFARDVAASRTIDGAAWAARPLGDRAGEWGARLLDYLL